MAIKVYEKEIEREACKFAKRHGWWVAKFVSPGLRGVPDRIYIRDGNVIFVEYKRPGEVPDEQQKLRHKELREHGVSVFVVDNLKDAYDILR